MTLQALFLAATIQFHLPANLINSVCWVETKHKVNAIHHDDGGADSLGVCQIKLATAQDLGFEGTAKQLMDPKTNITYSAAYLSYNIARYHGNVEKAVIAYNRGNARGLTKTAYSGKVLTQWRLINGK
jgi:soluble lytic murein transglycosylase-like protein